MSLYTRLAPLALLTVVACGPPSIVSEPSDTGETSDTGEDTGTPDPPPPDPPGEDDSEDDTTAASLTFVPDDDLICWLGCDPFAQDCPDGEKCVPYGSTGGSLDDNKCVAVTGSQSAGEPCVYGGVVEASDDCDATSICWYAIEVDGELLGTCTPLCTGTPDDPGCPDATSCLISYEGSVNVCISPCDPLTQDDCDEGQGCYWTGADFQCLLALDQQLGGGEPCGFLNDCAPGLICVDGEALPTCQGASCCTLYCDLTVGDAACEGMPGSSCVAFYEQDQAPPEHATVGVCVLPGA